MKTGLKHLCRTFVLKYIITDDLWIKNQYTVLFLSFWTDRLGKQCRPRSDCSYTVCYSVYVFWTHFSIVKPRCSNFRMITTNFLGVRIFRKCTVLMCLVSRHNQVVDTWPIIMSFLPYINIVLLILHCPVLLGL